MNFYRSRICMMQRRGFRRIFFYFHLNDFGSIVASCMFLVLLGGISLLGFGESKVGAKNCSKKYGWERRRCSRK